MTEHAPGTGWTCEEGKRHFVCGGCEQTFTSNPDFTVADIRAEAEQNLGAVPEPDDIMRVCDDCYPVLLERAREQGLVP